MSPVIGGLCHHARPSKDKISRGLTNPQITIAGDGRLAGSVLVDIDAPFDLPAKIREIMISKGEAVVLQ